MAVQGRLSVGDTAGCENFMSSIILHIKKGELCRRNTSVR